MKRIILYIRSGILNIWHFHTLSKKIVFGRNVNIEGNVTFGKKVILDDNVEVRNRTKEMSYIASFVSINRNTVIRGKVNIGEAVAIAPNCMIIGANHCFNDTNKPIKEQGVEVKGVIIESDVWIGANCCVLDGVTIGKGSVIGAGSIVTKSIPPMSIAVGNPCRVIKQRT
ncbi:MAG: acyltransferase [Bacteroidales bacterium]|nr:acyltransferase [Bacteroidales bacterium]